VLALVVSGFAEGRERTKALAIYAGVVTGGGSLGLVLGGVITQWLDWRWVLFINVPIGIAVVAATPLFVAETPRQPGRFDLAGAITSTAGVAALVYGFIRAASDGWGNRVALGAFAAAAVLLALFLRTEARAPQPITPLRLFADPSRSGSFVARLLLVGGMFGMFFFLTQFLQDVLGFTPLRAGLAFLPMTLLLFAVSRGVPRLMPVFGPWRLMIALLDRDLPADGAARGGHGRRVRAADHGLAGRGAAAGLRRRLQHGQRHAATRRVTGPSGACRGVRHRPPHRAGAPGARAVRGGVPAARARARHGPGVRPRGDLRRGGPADHRHPAARPAGGPGAGAGRDPRAGSRAGT
jgi:Major Facilitator Superfamily